MKRCREHDENAYAALERQRDEAYAHYLALCVKVRAHPMHEEEERKHEEKQLRAAVPAKLVNEWLETDFDDAGRLIGLSFDNETLDFCMGTHIRTWKMIAKFERDLCEYIVDIDEHDSDEFNLVEFNNDPCLMWKEALKVNQGNRIVALAAFCYACADKLCDFESKPAQAFD